METQINPGPKPRLLLHACCGVCNSYVPELLLPNFDVTVYYENSNIYPSEEFYRRLEAAKTMSESFGIPFIQAPYKPEEWLAGTKGMENVPENGARCSYCVAFRLAKTLNFAKLNGYGWVATTLSVSRRKNAQMINEMGERLSANYGINFLGRDWKKNGGENISQERAKKSGIYRQNYCGCIFSYQARQKE